MTPRPLVKFIRSNSKPMRPRVGMVASMVTLCGCVSIWEIAPLRADSTFMTLPMVSSGTSSQRFSNGSLSTPSSVLGDDERGARRVPRNPRGAFARPAPRSASRRGRRRRYTPARSDSSTWMLTLPFCSRSSRSRIWREVTSLPSRPTNGPSFTANSMRMVGGSISTKGRAGWSSSAHSVSPMSTSVKPARPTMLPATPSGGVVGLRAAVFEDLGDFVALARAVFEDAENQCRRSCTWPPMILPMAMRPT